LIILGCVLLLAGLLLPGLAILVTVGIIVIVVGLALAIAGGYGRPAGDRRFWW
jgi:membrane-bound ClpP family serine protease